MVYRSSPIEKSLELLTILVESLLNVTAKRKTVKITIKRMMFCRSLKFHAAWSEDEVKCLRFVLASKHFVEFQTGSSNVN